MDCKVFFAFHILTFYLFTNSLVINEDVSCPVFFAKNNLVHLPDLNLDRSELYRYKSLTELVFFLAILSISKPQPLRICK